MLLSPLPIVCWHCHCSCVLLSLLFTVVVVDLQLTCGHPLSCRQRYYPIWQWPTSLWVTMVTYTTPMRSRPGRGRLTVYSPNRSGRSTAVNHSLHSGTLQVNYTIIVICDRIWEKGPCHALTTISAMGSNGRAFAYISNRILNFQTHISKQWKQLQTQNKVQ